LALLLCLKAPSTERSGQTEAIVECHSERGLAADYGFD
jgi:hypothetical protein